MPTLCETHVLAAQIRTALLRDGMNIAGMAKQFGKPEDLIREILRKHVFDLSKAEMPKELKAYELVVLKGLRPSVAALQMRTGEEDIRYLLQNLTEDSCDSESDSEESTGDFEIHIIELTPDSETETETETETDDSSEESEESDSDVPRAHKYLRIYFDHAHEEDGRDILTVYRNSDRSYSLHWVFNETDTKKGNGHSVYYYTNREFMKYIRNLLHLTRVDKVPCRSVELHTPGYPAIAFTPRTLKKNTTAILEAIHDNFVDM